MKISTRTEYGIRVLVTLARVGPDDACLSLTEIARREKLPHAYLEQLVGDLRRAGLVSATRGQAGGYRLARPADEIAMTDAVRALEGPLSFGGSSRRVTCAPVTPADVEPTPRRMERRLLHVRGKAD